MLTSAETDISHTSAENNTSHNSIENNASHNSVETNALHNSVNTVNANVPYEISYPADIDSCLPQRVYFNHRCVPLSQDFPIHTHDNWELIFLIQGEVSYFMDGKNYPLFPNSLIVTRPGENHAVQVNKRTDYERYNILFDETSLSSQVYLQIPKEISVVHFKKRSLVSDLFMKMDYYCRNFEGQMLEVILLHLIEEVLYNILLAVRNTDLTSEYTVNPIILRAVEYIETNITRPLSLELLCEELHISRSYLHQLFICHLKTSPGQYILTKKLLSAHNDLCAGRSPTDVAYSYGFSDYTTFYRAYKKHYGHAPSEEAGHKTSFIIQS